MCILFMKHFKYFYVLIKYIWNIAIFFIYLIKIYFVSRLLDTKLMASTQPFKVLFQSELSFIRNNLNFFVCLRQNLSMMRLALNSPCSWILVPPASASHVLGRKHVPPCSFWNFFALPLITLEFYSFKVLFQTQ